MSFDDRLRRDLQRDADRIDVEVERNLGIVEARMRQRGPGSITTLLVAAVVIAVVVVIRLGATPPNVGGPTSSPGSSLPAASLGPAGTTFDAIAGTYTVTIDPALPAASSAQLGGLWTMRLLPDGEMLLSSPETFAYASISPTGVAFSLVGDRFRTNLFYNDFCNSVGTYTWSIQGGRLSFAPVDETCGVRQTLLSTLPWQAQP